MPKHEPTEADYQQLLQENDALRIENVRLRHQLTTKQHYASSLEFLLRERMERIDELTATIDQLREQNRRLEDECEHLAQMVAASAAQQQTNETSPRYSHEGA